MNISPPISTTFLASLKWAKFIMYASLLVLGVQALVSIYFPAIPLYGNGVIFIICFLSISYLLFVLIYLEYQIDRQKRFLYTHGQEGTVKLLSTTPILGFKGRRSEHSVRYYFYEVEFKGLHIILIDSLKLSDKIGQILDVKFDPVRPTVVSLMPKIP